MNKLVSILCEGPHDVAFITKVLKSDGYSSNEKNKLDQFPEPFSSLIIREATKANVKSLNIQELRTTLIPSSTLQKEDVYLFIYSIGSDSKRASRINYLKSIVNLIPVDGEISPYPNYELGIIYFFDADKIGVQNRIDSINLEIEEVTTVKPLKKNGDVMQIESLKIGAYIFTESNKDIGKLEDIMLPLMKINNEQIFDNAIEYLNLHISEERCVGSYDQQKSIIGICGQLQKSGGSNVVCISQSDYLSSEKIKADKICLDIINFVGACVS